VRKKGVADVKREFRRVLDAAERGESTVVLRHGRPVAVIAPVPPPDRPPLPRPRRPGGLLALVGTFEAAWPEIEDDLAAVVVARQSAPDRPPSDFA
jgi:prevent-host-death family protein